MKIAFSKDPPPSPLSNFVLREVFADALTAGLAAHSFASAVVGEDIGEITRVKAQQATTIAAAFGSVATFEAKNAQNDYTLVEIHIPTGPKPLESSFIAASHSIIEAVGASVALGRYRNAFPNVAIISILAERLRKGQEGYVEIAELAYGLPPYEAVKPYYATYNIQLDAFEEMLYARKGQAACNCLQNPLDCWIFALWASHTMRKSIGEVLETFPELARFYQEDEGFAQFCKRYSALSKDEDVLRRYADWIEERQNEETAGDDGEL